MKSNNILGFEIVNSSFNSVLKQIGVVRFVIPTNVDVLLKLMRNDLFRKLYIQHKEQTLLINDSQVLIHASKLILNKNFDERISGSDLLPGIARRATKENELRIFLLGGLGDAATNAMRMLNEQNSYEIVVGARSPSYGFEKNELECRDIVDEINQSGANILAVGVGAPKQEIWTFKHAVLMPDIKTFIAVGASIDFAAGKIRRAPPWISSLGLEWLFRLLIEPKRLWKRYLIENMPIFWHMVKQRFGKKYSWD